MDGIDPTTFQTWESVAALGLLVFAVSVVPQIASWIAASRARDAAERIEHEMRPNSGGSLRDAVDRLEVAVSEVSDGQKALAERMDAHEQEEQAVIDETQARLEAVEGKRWWRPWA